MCKIQSKLAALGLAVAVCAGLMGAAPAPYTTTALLTPTAANTLATGVVLRDGVPVEGAKIKITLWPASPILESLKPGAIVPTIDVGVFITDRAGRFTATGDLAALRKPGYVEVGAGADHLTAFQVDVVDGASLLGWNFSTMPNSTGKFWRSQYGGDKITTDFKFDLGTQPLAIDTANDPKNWVDPQLAAKPYVRALTATERSQGPQWNCRWVFDRVAWPHVHEWFANVRHNDAGVMEVITSQASSVTHTLGVSYKPLVGGAWGASGGVGKTLSEGQEAVFPVPLSSRIMNAVNMAKYVETGIPPRPMCIDPRQRAQTYSTYDLAHGSSPIAKLDYSYGPITRLKGWYWWKQDANNSTYSAGLEFAGVALSAQSGWGTSNRMYYEVVHTRALHRYSSPDGPAQSAGNSFRIG